MKWYKRDPDAFKGGTIGLSLEEVGAYTLILDDLYCRNGQIPDDERYVCRLLRCDPRVWRRIRERLFALGKLQSENNLLLNVRCTSVVHRYLVKGKNRGKSTKNAQKSDNRIQNTEVKAPKGPFTSERPSKKRARATAALRAAPALAPSPSAQTEIEEHADAHVLAYRQARRHAPDNPVVLYLAQRQRGNGLAEIAAVERASQ